MSHRIIYIEKCECLKLYLDNIKVIYNDNDILLPISDIQILVIDNYKSSLSIPLINKLTENNRKYKQIVKYKNIKQIINKNINIKIQKCIDKTKSEWYH